MLAGPVLNVQEREDLQFVDKSFFALFGAFGNSAESTLIGSEKSDNEICFGMVPGVNDQGLSIEKAGQGEWLEDVVRKNNGYGLSCSMWKSDRSVVQRKRKVCVARKRENKSLFCQPLG